MKYISLLVLILMFSGCTKIVDVYPLASGGSLADAVIDVSYSYTNFEKPIVNWESAQKSAEDRCSLWGFSGAKKFDGISTKCSLWSRSICQSHTVSVSYQCLPK